MFLRIGSLLRVAQLWHWGIYLSTQSYEGCPISNQLLGRHSNIPIQCWRPKAESTWGLGLLKVRHLCKVPWLTPSRRTLLSIGVATILVLSLLAVLKINGGGRQVPTKELPTGSIPRAAAVVSLHPTIRSSLFSHPRLHLSRNPRKSLWWIGMQFLCLARGQNGCEIPLEFR